jgi:hypothetical protein
MTEVEVSMTTTDDQRELELRRANERAEREKLEAIARSERIQKETEERIARENAELKRRDQEAAEKRQKDKKRVELVRSEIAKRLSDLTPEEAADEMMAGEFPHITVII